MFLPTGTYREPSVIGNGNVWISAVLYQQGAQWFLMMALGNHQW